MTHSFYNMNINLVIDKDIWRNFEGYQNAEEIKIMSNMFLPNSMKQ